jgi:hypothetical protein
MLANARYRARRDDVPFTITLGDIIIPTRCPALGIKLVAASGKRGGTSASPSLDRIVPELGYVPGNVRVISYRANTIKSVASAEELQRVLSYAMREAINLTLTRR